MKTDVNKLGFVLASPQRTAIVKAMDKMYTSTSVWKRAKQKMPKMGRSHCTRNLTAMAHEGIVECVNPSSYIGRVYRLTPLGNNLREVIMQQVGDVI